MRVRIDQPGDHDCTVAVFAEVGLRHFVPRGQDLRDLALVVDHQRGEPLELAILADRKTLDIVDQHVRRGGRGERKSEGGYEEFE